MKNRLNKAGKWVKSLIVGAGIVGAATAAQAGAVVNMAGVGTAVEAEGELAIAAGLVVFTLLCVVTIGKRIFKKLAGG